MSAVRVERKISKNYQSKGVAVELDVLDGWTTQEIFELAEGMAFAMLGMKVKNRKRINELLREYYNDDDLHICDYEADATIGSE